MSMQLSTVLTANVLSYGTCMYCGYKHLLSEYVVVIYDSDIEWNLVSI